MNTHECSATTTAQKAFTPAELIAIWEEHSEVQRSRFDIDTAGRIMDSFEGEIDYDRLGL